MFYTENPESLPENLSPHADGYVYFVFMCVYVCLYNTMFYIKNTESLPGACDVFRPHLQIQCRGAGLVTQSPGDDWDRAEFSGQNREKLQATVPFPKRWWGDD